MLRALLVVAREIALAHDNWLAKLARLRPLAAENAALRVTVERQRAENELGPQRTDSETTFVSPPWTMTSCHTIGPASG